MSSDVSSRIQWCPHFATVPVALAQIITVMSLVSPSLVIEKGKDWPMIAPHQLVGTRIAASLQFSIFSMENTICPARYPLLAVLFCLQTFITLGLPSL